MSEKIRIFNTSADRTQLLVQELEEKYSRKTPNRLKVALISMVIETMEKLSSKQSDMSWEETFDKGLELETQRIQEKKQAALEDLLEKRQGWERKTPVINNAGRAIGTAANITAGWLSFMGGHFIFMTLVGSNPVGTIGALVGLGLMIYGGACGYKFMADDVKVAERIRNGLDHLVNGWTPGQKDRKTPGPA